MVKRWSFVYSRAKYHKLKYGTELNQGEVKMPSFESGRSIFEVACGIAVEAAGIAALWGSAVDTVCTCVVLCACWSGWLELFGRIFQCLCASTVTWVVV